MNRPLVWILLVSAVVHLGGFALVRHWSFGPATCPSPLVPSATSQRSEPEPLRVTLAPESTPSDTPVIATTNENIPAFVSTLPAPTDMAAILKNRMSTLHAGADSVALPLDTHRTIVFMLDKSGSMYETVSGTRRVDFAMRELRKLITGLDRRTRFNVLIYAEKTIAFQSNSVFANPENKLNAIRFLQRDDPCGGATDFPEAYQAALSSKPDTILVLTDGEFNVLDQNLISQTRKIREKFSSDARLNALGFFIRPDTNAGKLLSRLCAETQGELQFWKSGAPSRVAFLPPAEVTVP